MTTDYKEPYWVQIEMPPEGSVTGCMHVNFANIGKAVFQREGNDYKIKKAAYCEIGSNDLVDVSKFAEEFHDAWIEYLKTHQGGLKFEAEKAPVSNIVNPRFS